MSTQSPQEFFIPGLTSQTSIRFLSDTSFITLLRPLGHRSAGCLGCIDLYDFAPSINTLPSTGSHVATFWLPRWNASDASYPLSLAFEKSSTNHFASDDCIIAFRSRRLSDISDDTRVDSHLFVTPKKSFLSVLDGPRSSHSALHFQWGEWGMPGVRCIPVRDLAAVGIFRDRALLLASWRERYLLDFNQRRVKHALRANSNPTLWPSGGGCSAQIKCSTVPEGLVDPLEGSDALGAERLPFAATPWGSENFEPAQFKRGIVMDDKHVVLVGVRA